MSLDVENYIRSLMSVHINQLCVSFYIAVPVLNEHLHILLHESFGNWFQMSELDEMNKVHYL